MPSYAFISYSHHDATAYVERLAAFLGQAGVRVWYDKEIVTGDRWARLIKEKIDGCGALIVVMTPSGVQSDWVEREISEALEDGIPIFPLLLEGRRYFQLANLQFEDVRTGELPSASFVARVTSLLTAGPTSAEQIGLQRRHDHAVQVGESGRHADAIRLLTAVVDDRARVLGPNHVDTLTSRHYLAWAVSRIEIGRAIEMFKILAADREVALGPEHVDTLASRHHLGRCLGVAGRHAEAVAQLRDVASDRARVLGNDHPDTLQSRRQLARFLGEGGNAAEGAALLRELVPDFTRVLGTEHPDALLARAFLANLTARAGDRAQALQMLRELMPDYVRVFGPDHSWTRTEQAKLRALEAEPGRP